MHIEIEPLSTGASISQRGNSAYESTIDQQAQSSPFVHRLESWAVGAEEVEDGIRDVPLVGLERRKTPGGATSFAGRESE